MYSTNNPGEQIAWEREDICLVVFLLEATFFYTAFKAQREQIFTEVKSAINSITDYAESKCTNCEDGHVPEYDGEYYTTCRVCGGMGNNKVFTKDVIDTALEAQLNQSNNSKGE